MGAAGRQPMARRGTLAGRVRRAHRLGRAGRPSDCRRLDAGRRVFDSLASVSLTLEVARMSARVGVVTFPGSLDDRDAQRAIRLAGGTPVALWHGDADLGDVQAVVLPGGFSYGDYLRCGAIARFSPVMGAVIDAAAGGLPVLGICNGFQVLCESHLLPGALVRNAGQQVGLAEHLK